ncbi:MAG: DUF2939 domain-containing protein [Candidatus Parabeggiatoa sp.]|nr:DUF2939 domain-containing protein [Candidatus Parabeggiatoa sp.]
MRYFSFLIFMAIMGYLVWPYVHLYQLNDAVNNNDKAAMEKLVDFEEVNKVNKENLKWKSEQMSGGLLPDMIKKGAEMMAGEIDANEIVMRLRAMEGSPWDQTSFAFFESPTRFTIRLGQLGQNPIHVQMTLQDWYWRITAIYD